jgi:hypothetical protein
MKHTIFLSLLITLFAVRPADAQHFKYEADIPSVSSSGFYKIYLAPQITAKLQRHYPDIRIYNRQTEEIPFLYDTDKQMASPDSTKILNIIQNKHRLLKSHTSVIIKNDSLKPIDNFAFLIDNTGIRKWIKISASKDQKEWYVVKDNFPAQAAYSDSSKTELLISNIPAGEFPYYKIIFYDYNNQAVKIHKAYTYESPLAQQNYAKLPELKISHTDTLHRTVVYLEFEKAQFIDRITFDIEGPKYFFRNAVFEKPGENRENEGKLFYDEIKKEIQLSSDKKNILDLSHYKAKAIKITIDNRNNPPLRIKKATAYQQKSYLIAYLKTDEKYTVHFGNSQVDFPIYDLEYFKEQIPKNIKTLKIQSIKHKQNGDNKLFSSKIWNMPIHYLWLGMGLVGLILLYLTGKMVWRQYKSGRE